MKILKVIAIVVVVLLVVVLGWAFTRPDTVKYSRSTTIDAPPEKIAPLVADFHSWSRWSPYEKLDPAMKRSFSGAPNGKGAVYAWDGNSKAGAGRMEITDASMQRVGLNLDFIRPITCNNVVEFTLQPQGKSTKVTWSMSGPNLFIGKVMSLFMDMDRMVGRDFETGLHNLKTVAETANQKG